MLYFAELEGKQIKTAEGRQVGRLSDLLFLGSGQPLITKLVMRTKSGEEIIPITNIQTFGDSITLTPDYQTTDATETELTVHKHLLDQQIIDLKGNKVVRVNDVVIQEKPYLIVAGVDVGVLGIARWFNLEQFINKNIAIFGKAVTSDFLSWDDIQPVALNRGKVVLKKEETKLTRLAPEDLADHLERLSIKNLSKVLDLLPEQYEAEVIQNLNIGFQQTLFRKFRNDHAAKIIDKIDLDEAADILLTLPEKRRELILGMLDEAKTNELRTLLSLSVTPIGDLITTTGYITAAPSQTAKSVLTNIHEHTSNFSFLNYVYVINKDNELVGVCNLHELIIQDSDMPMYKFMIQNVIVLHLTTPLEIAIKRMIKYQVYALPVVDNKRHILGSVTFDDLSEQLAAKFM